MSSIQACWLHQTDRVGNTLSDMLQASRYWQPDRESLWTGKLKDGALAVGLSKAQLYNTARSVNDTVYHMPHLGLAITANARIDNRDALITLLEIHRDNPEIATDSQLILHCYARWGNECVRKLRGDFVFIVWDENKQKMFIARDHFGTKVLFYSRTSQGVMLTNEHNAFFTAHWLTSRSVNEKWLIEQLWGLVPTSFDSPHPEVMVLPPAHTLEIDNQGLKLNCYWHLEPSSKWSHFSDNDYIEELSRRFSYAVINRLDSDYPIGAELSEGLDSNGIVGVGANHLKTTPNQTTPLYTFSYRCEALTEKNQSIWKNTYADIEEMQNMHSNLKPVWKQQPNEENTPLNAKKAEEAQEIHLQQFYQNFGGVVRHQGSNFIRPELALSKGCRTLLSGWGGDHCVTSYGDQYLNELFQRGRFYTLTKLLKSQYRRGRGGKPSRTLISIALKQFTPKVHLRLTKRRQGLERALEERSRNHFLSRTWVKRYHLDKRLDAFQRAYQRDTVQQKEQLELFELDLSNRLTISELVSRQFRVEYRYPMLDVDLVEFAHSIPSHLKIHEGIERYPFRRVLDGITTQRIQHRCKADVNHPKKDSRRERQVRIQALSQKLTRSPLLLHLGKPKALEKCIQFGDKAMIEQLEFLARVEGYYPRDIWKALIETSPESPAPHSSPRESAG